MKLEHRLSGYDLKKPTYTCLADSVGNMADRAESVLFLIQTEFTGDRTLDDDVIFSSLESVRMEILDIKAVIDNYHEAQNHEEDYVSGRAELIAEIAKNGGEK